MSKTAAALFIVLVLALGWRCFGITYDSLWLDEGYQSIVDAYGQPLPNFRQIPERAFIYKPAGPVSPSDMLRNFRNLDPLTPPLYQLLLNRWITVFGGSDLALRILSVIISTACVGVVFWVAHKIFGLRAAVFGGLVQAFSPFDICYGQEVRMYGLVALTATLSFGTFVLLLLHQIRGRARLAGWALYVVATWALINTHYTGLFLVFAEGMLGVAIAFMRRSWRLFGVLVLAWITVGILWLPWLNLFFQAAAVRTASFYVSRKPTIWWPFLALFVRIPCNWIVFLAGKHVVAPAIPIFATSFLSLCAAAVAVPKLERSARIAAILILIWAIVPALVLWAIDVLENHRVIEIARYMMCTAPAIYILVGVGLARLKLRHRWAVALVVAHFAFASINNVAHATLVHQREPWYEMAHALENQVSNDQLVLIAQHYNILCLDRYLKVPFKQVGVDSTMSEPEVDKLLYGQSKFALITAQEGEAFKNLIPSRFRVVRETNLAHGLHLRSYEQPLPPE